MRVLRPNVRTFNEMEAGDTFVCVNGEYPKSVYLTVGAPMWARYRSHGSMRKDAVAVDLRRNEVTTMRKDERVVRVDCELTVTSRLTQEEKS